MKFSLKEFLIFRSQKRLFLDFFLTPRLKDHAFSRIKKGIQKHKVFQANLKFQEYNPKLKALFLFARKHHKNLKKNRLKECFQNLENVHRQLLLLK